MFLPWLYLVYLDCIWIIALFIWQQICADGNTLLKYEPVLKQVYFL